MKAAGGIGAAGVVGGAGLFALSGGASATANASYGDVTITSDDGSIEYISIYGASTVEWDGFDNEATAFEIVTEARIPGEVGWTQLNSSGPHDLSQSSWGGPGEEFSGVGTSGTIESDIGLKSNNTRDPNTDWHVVGSQSNKDVDGYGLPQNRIDPSNISNPSDGDDADYTIELRTTYTWYASGDVEFEETFTADVGATVENEPRSASASGSNSGAYGQ